MLPVERGRSHWRDIVIPSPGDTQMFIVESKSFLERFVRMPYIRRGSPYSPGKQWVVVVPTKGSKLIATSTGFEIITIQQTGYFHFFGSPFLKAFKLWWFLLGATSVHDSCLI